MAIILEGMDGCGKSTLAEKLGLKVVHPGAPPKTPEAERLLFSEQQRRISDPIIYDRVTCISQQVYRKRMDDPWYTKPMNQLISTPHCIVVYCRPPDHRVLDISSHTVSPHDTVEMLDLVRDNAALFLESYDILMSKIPHIVYDYTSSNFAELKHNIITTQFRISEWTKCIKHLQTTL